MEKSELSEYLIRFQIALLVFEIFPFEIKSFFVKIRHFSLVFRINDQLNSVQYSQKSNKLCRRRGEPWFKVSSPYHFIKAH